MSAKQNIQKINEWKAKNIKRINLEFRTDTGILDRIEAAVKAGYANSRQAYIVQSVNEKLDRDGIPMIVPEEQKESPDE